MLISCNVWVSYCSPVEAKYAFNMAAASSVDWRVLLDVLERLLGREGPWLGRLPRCFSNPMAGLPLVLWEVTHLPAPRLHLVHQCHFLFSYSTG